MEEILRDDVYRTGLIAGEKRMRILLARLIRACQMDLINLVIEDCKLRDFLFHKYGIDQYYWPTDYPDDSLLTQEDIARAQIFETVRKAIFDLADLTDEGGDA